MFPWFPWRRFVVAEIRISKIPEMRFYMTFGFLGFKPLHRRRMNPLEGSEDFGFSDFIWLE